MLTEDKKQEEEERPIIPCSIQAVHNLEPELTSNWPPACEELWMRIAQLYTPGYFITAEVQHTGNQFPEAIVSYIQNRLLAFQQGVKNRKFIFQSNDWRIVLTFFPTNQVVEERYALKNKGLKIKKTKISLSFPK